VLPVGGIKEKVLAAHRSGLKTVILPRRNEADLEDLPEEVRSSINFVFVETVDQVLACALAETTEKSGQKTKKGRTVSRQAAPKNGKKNVENPAS
jgi:ATP-dependent Lon protease